LKLASPFMMLEGLRLRVGRPFMGPARRVLKLEGAGLKPTT
jgi:hypothetical protein